MNAVVLLIAGMSVCVSVRADDTYVVGGLGPTKFATEEVQDLVDLLREEIISELPLGYDQEKPLPEFTARLYREQVVAGTNFFVKVETGPLRFIHVRIHADLTGEAHVVEVQIGKTMGDSLEYF
ncbi:cystatin-A2 [Magallana gigas]|uniref:Cystatin domain-containing protein n=1 Tax=Magallana gigas TaxID=29159 RepID=A0A8W8LK65_MAGGI|nr:cystatin-A [Crassostrea gigas]